MITKSRDKTNISMSLVPHTPVCEASLLLPGHYSLDDGVLVVEGGEEGEKKRILLRQGAC